MPIGKAKINVILRKQYFHVILNLKSLRPISQIIKISHLQLAPSNQVNSIINQSSGKTSMTQRSVALVKHAFQHFSFKFFE